MAEAKLTEMKDEEMYVFIAPNGDAQLTKMAPEYAMCIAFTRFVTHWQPLPEPPKSNS